MTGYSADPAPVSGYQRAPVHNLANVSFAAGLAPGVHVLGMEACQTIQDLANSVTLVADKATVVRVYLEHGELSQDVSVTGELVWRRSPTGAAGYVPASGRVRLDPANPVDIAGQRHDVAASLNFRLPPEAIAAGTIFVELGRLIRLGGEDVPLAPHAPAELRFVAAPPIRVKTIGLRYTDMTDSQQHTPDAVHFAYFRSYLKRAYPVPDVVWSQIVLDADFVAPFGATTAVRANAQLAAIRNAEINLGADPRTHYFGLVDDADGRHFMRGRALGIPEVPRPDTVASGPCGVPNGFAGDNDVSYADWYGAHELGHTFGRYHPGFPPNAQDASDLDFPYADGKISHADGQYVGFDVGDPELSLPMAALPGTIHHDVMTYGDRQWLSAHTFEAIRLRLLEEDQLFAPLIV